MKALYNRVSSPLRRGDDLSSLKILALLATAATNVGCWLAFMLKAPALSWTTRPLPFEQIHEQAWRWGPLTDTMLLLVLLLGGYLALAWVVETGEADLPAWLVLTVSGLCGVLAVLTYALFAEDVNFVLAHVWSYVVAGVNPYAVPLEGVPRNPYLAFTGYDSLSFIYGPVWLAIGVAVMQTVGPGILAFVGTTKLLQLGTLWLLGWLAWHLARITGSRRPWGRTALVLWNPLLLVDGVMTPHPDLLMATALLGSLLAWARQREAAAVALFGLSVGVKFFTLVLAPALPLALAAAGVLAGPRGRGLLSMFIGCSLGGLALWPGVWEPFLSNGLPQELDVATDTALLPNALTMLQAAGFFPDGPAHDAWELAEAARWWAFVPAWLWGTGLCALVASRQRPHLPLSLCEPLVLLLLGYHLLFTLVVLPWHFTTAICLCLAGRARTTRAAGLLITVSGLLSYINDQWVWQHPWEDPVAIGWVLALSLLIGPLLAVPLLLGSVRASCRAPSTVEVRSALPARVAA